MIKNRLTRFLLIFLAVLLIPLIAFSVFQYQLLGESEEMTEDIYKDRMKAISFSINQLSNDIMTSWQQQLNRAAQQSDSALLRQVLQLPINSITLFSKNNEVIEAYPSSGYQSTLSQDLISRLLRYSESNYYKIEPIDDGNPDLFKFAFILNSREHGDIVALTEISSESLINDLLDPRLDQMANQGFAISIINVARGELIYSSAENINPKTAAFTDDFWLFPDYQITLQNVGQDLDDLVQERFVYNIVIFLLLMLLLFIAIIIIFIFLRKELRLAQAKSDFVSNVSHELRTPLSLIQMFAETLQLNRVKSEEKKQEYYDIIVNETGRLSRLVNKILNFSQYDNGKKIFQFEDFNVNDLISELIKSYTYEIEQAQVKFNIDFTDDPLVIPADKEAVGEAIVNLIDNAIKYSSAEKLVSIKTYRKDQKVCISVSDNGMGIAPENQKKIFDKFYRVRASSVSIKGTGLGLAIVKNVMDIHKGQIDVASKPGEGATFTLVFNTKKNNA